jgi:hypothetical protein
MEIMNYLSRTKTLNICGDFDCTRMRDLLVYASCKLQAVEDLEIIGSSLNIQSLFERLKFPSLKRLYVSGISDTEKEAVKLEVSIFIY